MSSLPPSIPQSIYFHDKYSTINEDNILLSGKKLNKEIILQLLEYNSKYKTKLFKFLKSVIIKSYLNYYHNDSGEIKKKITQQIQKQLDDIINKNSNNTLDYFDKYGIYNNISKSNILNIMYGKYKENIIYYNTIEKLLNDLLHKFSFNAIILDIDIDVSFYFNTTIDKLFDDVTYEVYKKIMIIFENLKNFSFLKKSDGSIASLLGVTILFPKNSKENIIKIPDVLINIINDKIISIMKNIIDMIRYNNFVKDEELFTDFNNEIKYDNNIKFKKNIIEQNIKSINNGFSKMPMNITTLCRTLFFKYLENLINYNLYNSMETTK